MLSTAALSVAYQFFGSDETDATQESEPPKTLSEQEHEEGKQDNEKQEEEDDWTGLLFNREDESSVTDFEKELSFHPQSFHYNEDVAILFVELQRYSREHSKLFETAGDAVDSLFFILHTLDTDRTLPKLKLVTRCRRIVQSAGNALDAFIRAYSEDVQHKKASQESYNRAWELVQQIKNILFIHLKSLESLNRILEVEQSVSVSASE